MQIALRPSTESDVDLVVDYFLGVSHEALRAMGVDPARLPERAAWKATLLADVARGERLIATWLSDGEAVGHSSVNGIVLGEEAFIHLHLWKPELRREGLGTELFRLSLDYFFERLRLRRLLCEPYAENPAPNRVLARCGFRLLGRHRTVPGAINFEQDVNRWVLER